jgi:hypothetical protein
MPEKPVATTAEIIPVGTSTEPVTLPEAAAVPENAATSSSAQAQAPAPAALAAVSASSAAPGTTEPKRKRIIKYFTILVDGKPVKIKHEHLEEDAGVNVDTAVDLSARKRKEDREKPAAVAPVVIIPAKSYHTDVSKLVCPLCTNKLPSASELIAHLGQGKAHVKYSKSEEGQGILQKLRDLEEGVEVLEVEQETEEDKLQAKFDAAYAHGDVVAIDASDDDDDDAGGGGGGGGGANNDGDVDMDMSDNDMDMSDEDTAAAATNANATTSLKMSLQPLTQRHGQQQLGKKTAAVLSSNGSSGSDLAADRAKQAPMAIAKAPAVKKKPNLAGLSKFFKL